MSGTDPALLIRLDAVAEAVSSLNGLLASQASLDEALDHVARHAVTAVPAADAVSITVLGGPTPRTVACTEEFARALDAAQYEGDAGPCLAAARSGHPVRTTTSPADESWPTFTAAARAAGVQATLSMPLLVASDRTGDATRPAGSLNVFSLHAAQFDAVDEKLLGLYTQAAADAVAMNRQCRVLREKVAQLEEALVSRSDIDQAKGALRVLNGVSADDAFEVLVRRSQNENIKIRDLARRVVDDLARGIPAR